MRVPAGRVSELPKARLRANKRFTYIEKYNMQGGRCPSLLWIYWNLLCFAEPKNQEVVTAVLVTSETSCTLALYFLLFPVSVMPARGNKLILYSE